MNRVYVCPTSTAQQSDVSATVASLHMKTNAPPEQRGINQGWGCLTEITLEHIIHQCFKSFRAIVCKSSHPFWFLNENGLFYSLHKTSIEFQYLNN